MIYFDWAATALPDPAILDKVRDAEKEYFGNPSSIHAAGRKAKKLLSQSRETLAGILKVEPGEVVFTSGGTESNNIFLFSLLSRSLWKGAQRKKIILSGIEHPSVYNPALFLGHMGFDVIVIPPGEDGCMDPQKINETIDPNTVLVACMHVNNEIGAIQPVKEAGTIVREAEKKMGKRIFFYVDAVQSFGKIVFHPYSMNIDAASISAHKIGGVKGSGALFVRKDISHGFLYQGGDQEEMRRPGTENIAGCYSLALTAQKAVMEMDVCFSTMSSLMDRLLSGLSAINGVVFIPGSRKEKKTGNFSPYILKVSFPRIPGEVLVRMLEQKDIMISTGSACSSQRKKGKNRVLKSMGIPLQVAESSIRISTGYSTTEQDIDALVSALKELVPGLKKIV
ncbi:MAG: cysteine desulfurase [Spirochaetales bacterium]|nr:cysteine desulfurase [Spirochaetales bacterium]